MSQLKGSEDSSREKKSIFETRSPVVTISLGQYSTQNLNPKQPSFSRITFLTFLID